jgi:ATP-dependent Clp protease ATP-binding subunit ClpA
VKVIVLAQEEAQRLGHNILGPGEILLGLISEGTTLAYRSLREAGLNLNDARSFIEETIGHSGSFMAVQIPFAAGTKSVLQKAEEEAHAAGVNYVSTEHILLGILTERNAVSTKLFEKFDIDTHQLEKKVREAISQTAAEQIHSRLPEPTLTEDVLATLVFANEEARKLKHKRTGVEHILCGLILQEGVAKRVLLDHGVTLEKARAIVDQMHKEEPVEPKRRPVFSKLLDTILVIFRQRPFTRQAELLMDNAMKETQESGALFVDTGHILLALIATSIEPNNALALLSIDKQALREQVLELMSSSNAQE